jgi:hypothetical protein
MTVVVATVVSVHAQAPQRPQGNQPVVRAGGNIRATNVPDGPTPRLADGKPDMSGVWLGGVSYGNITSALRPGDTIELLPEARTKMRARMAREDPGTNCLPLTIPRGTPYPWRMVVTPTHVFFLHEMYHYRQAFLGLKAHPPLEELDPTWYGHSIGRWEGDTLVIDTIGFNDKGWLDSRGHPVSEKLHVIERYTRTNMGTMAMEFTIDDPGSYAKPFTVRATARLMVGDELREYVCAENNQDVPHIEGPADTRTGGAN